MILLSFLDANFRIEVKTKCPQDAPKAHMRRVFGTMASNAKRR
jgi:hypothetical protein